MYLLNISSKFLPEFKKNFGDLEQRSGLSFVFLYGFMDRVSFNSLKESIQKMKESGEIPASEERPLFPIIVGGTPANEEYGVKMAPAFSTDYGTIQDFQREGVGFFSRKKSNQTLKNFKEENVIPIKSPSKATFGELFLPSESNDLPMLFIYYNIFDTKKSKLSTRVFKYLLSSALSQMVSGFRKPTFKVKEVTPDVVGKLENLVNKLAKTNIKELKDLDESIRSASEKLIGLTRKRKSLVGSMNAIASKERITHQIEKIKEHPKVLWVDVDDTFIKVMTEEITISKEFEDSNRKYSIGHIIMKIDINSGNVYFDNVTRRVKGLSCNNSSHPHDASSGDNSMCLGEISQYIPMMVSEMELEGMVELLLNYAKSVNIGDPAGKTIIRWPREK